MGATQEEDIDVRIVSATHRDLAEMVSKGEFREDLFYRLNVLPIYLPPLRERKEDIPILINHFISRYCQKNNRKTVEINPPALKILEAYHWPGNIRELRNVIERAVLVEP